MSTRMSKNNDNNYERGDKCLVLFYFTYVSIKKKFVQHKKGGDHFGQAIIENNH